MAIVYETEIPAFYLDALVLDSAPAAPLLLVSRNPEPGAKAVPKGTNVDLTLVSTSTAGATIVASSLFVYVNGVVAVSAGAPANGFAATFTSITGASAMTRVVVDPPADFLSMSTVTVRVVGATSTGGTLDASYTFTIEDLTAPMVVAAQATSPMEVQVAFDEALRQLDASAANDALNPANYVLTPLEAPAVSPLVTSVRAVTTNLVALTLDQRASFGKRYRVTVVNVSDVFGNAVQVPFNTADLTAPALPKPVGRDFDLYRMLPEMNRREDTTRDLFNFTACLQEVTDLLLGEVDRFQDFIDPDATTAAGVDAMLRDLGNPFAFDLSDMEKRRLVQLLVPLYKQKGTEVGIRNAIRLFLDLDVAVTAYLGEGLALGESELGVDWVLGPSSSFMRYAFDVVSGIALTATQRERIRSIVEYMKPAHTHFITLVEPVPPTVVDHMELGLSSLGETWDLHGT